MNAFYDIDYNIIRDILVKAHDIAKNKTYLGSNKSTQIDLLSILEAYSLILGSKCINASKDTDYYKFLLDLSVENNKLKQSDWWASFEKLRVKYQRRKIAFKFYTRTLYQKTLVGFLKQRFMNSEYDQSKLKEYSRKDYMSAQTSVQPQSKVATVRADSKLDKNRNETSFRSENRSDTLLHKTLLSFTPPRVFTDLSRSASKDMTRDLSRSKEKNRPNKEDMSRVTLTGRSPSPTTQRKTPFVPGGSNMSKHRLSPKNENSAKSFKEQKPPVGLPKNNSRKNLVIGVKSPTEPAITPKQTPLNFEKSPTINLNTSVTKSPKTIEEKDNSFTPVLGRTVAFVNEFTENTTRKNPKQILDMNTLGSKTNESFARKDTSTQVDNILITGDDPNVTHLTTNQYKTDGSGKNDYSRFFSEFSMRNVNTTENKTYITECSFTKDDISCFVKSYEDPGKEDDYKIMSRIFTRWSIYARKHKKKKEEKRRLIENTVKAMEINYRNLITKAFVSLGTVTIKKKRICSNYEKIKSNYEKKLMRNAMDKYIITFKTLQKEKFRDRKASNFHKNTLLKRKFRDWKHISDVRIRKIKPFQVPWQPKMLIEIIANTFKISMKKGYHSVIAKIPQHIVMPPSREWRVLDSISLLNNHLVQSGFANWKIYTKKCLEIKTYYEQISKRKTYLFWKHYSMKRVSLREKEDNLEYNQRLTRLQKSWVSLKRHAIKRKMLAKKQKLIQLEHDRKRKIYYFSFWNNTFAQIDRERQLDQGSVAFHQQLLLSKAFRSLKKSFEERLHKLSKKHKVNAYLASKVLHNIFSVWRAWSHKRAVLSSRCQKFKLKSIKEFMKAHLSGWRSQLREEQKVFKFRAKFLRRRGMQGFLRYYLAQKHNEDIADKFLTKLEERRFSQIFNEFIAITVRKSTVRKILQINQEKRYVELLNMSFASLFANMINKLRTRRRVEGITQIRQKSMKSKVLQAWNNFTQKSGKLNYLYSNTLSIKQLENKARILHAWVNQYRFSVEEREYEEHYADQANSKIKSAIFSFWKKIYDKTRQKSLISADFYTLTTLSKSFHALDEYLYYKRAERNQVTQFRRKYDMTFVKKVISSLRLVTLNNESKRKMRNRALNHCLTSKITRIFSELKKHSVQSAKDKKVEKKLKITRSFNLFERWRDTYKLTVARKAMNKKLYLRTGIAFFDYMNYKKAQNKKLAEFIKKQSLNTCSEAYEAWLNYLLIRRKKKNLASLAKKIELYQKKKLMDAWKEEYNKVITSNDVAQAFIEKRQDNVKRLFLDLLGIKRQKNVLRGMLLERFKSISREIYLKKWFMIFAEAVFTHKTMQRAKVDYTVKKEHKTMHKYFDQMKEFLNTQRQLTERAISYSERSNSNLKHDIMEEWKNYVSKKRSEKFQVTKFQRNLHSKVLDKYFSQMRHQYEVRSKSALISERFGKTNESLQLNKCYIAWSQYLKLQRRKRTRNDVAVRFHQYHLKKWVLDAFQSFNKTSRLNKYQTSVASQFYLQKSYEKFVAAICFSLKKRHQKITAMKHYADTVPNYDLIILKLTLKSMQQLKNFTKNKFMFRYKKIMETIEEERPLSAQSKSSKKSFSNLDAPFADNNFILREKDINI